MVNYHPLPPLCSFSTTSHLRRRRQIWLHLFHASACALARRTPQAGAHAAEPSFHHCRGGQWLPPPGTCRGGFQNSRAPSRALMHMPIYHAAWIFVKPHQRLIILCGTEETKWKYSPPSLHRLANSGQETMIKRSRAGNRSRRPCGNSFISDSVIFNSPREVRPCIPSGSAFRLLHPLTLRLLSLARFPRFEGSLARLLQFEISNFSRDSGRVPF